MCFEPGGRSPVGFSNTNILKTNPCLCKSFQSVLHDLAKSQRCLYLRLEFPIFFRHRLKKRTFVSKKLTKILTSARAKRVYVISSSLIVLLLVCDNIVMPWLVSRGGIVEVPEVTGLKSERAQSILDSLGLEPRQSEIRPDLRYPLGRVIAQVPAAGAKVRPGRRIYLTVSGGEPVAQVPSLKGRSLRDAEFALQRVGLGLGSTSFMPSDDFPPNTVIDQSVAAGSMVKKGSPIAVVISQGKESDRIAVPEVVGKILTEAEKTLTQRGLKVGNVSYQENLELLPNTVLAQYPRGGELVSLGQPIDLFVVQVGAKKPKEVLEN
jgi:beta-lactam-binding protein with PASTA domain